MPVLPVDALSDARLSVFTGRVSDDLFIAESPAVVESAIAAGIVPQVMLAERAQAARFAHLPCPVYTADRETLSAITGYHLTRGVLCAMRRPAPMDADFVCAGRQRVAVLERVADPANVGAVFRCAAALGIDGVLLDPNCADPLYRKAVRAAMGTVFTLPWARCDDPIAVLHRNGYFCIAMAIRDDCVDIVDPALRRYPSIGIVLGNEGHGLTDAAIAACDAAAMIPMHNHVDSLNIATAAAIAFHTLRAVPASMGCRQAQRA